MGRQLWIERPVRTAIATPVKDNFLAGYTYDLFELSRFEKERDLIDFHSV
jgi:hypothetical protein